MNSFYLWIRFFGVFFRKLVNVFVWNVRLWEFIVRLESVLGIVGYRVFFLKKFLEV